MSIGRAEVLVFSILLFHLALPTMPGFAFTESVSTHTYIHVQLLERVYGVHRVGQRGRRCVIPQVAFQRVRRKNI